MSFLKAWAWKREGLPDRKLFELPYVYHFNKDLPPLTENGREVEGVPHPTSITIHQSYTSLGNTVWDSVSSID